MSRNGVRCYFFTSCNSSCNPSRNHRPLILYFNIREFRILKFKRKNYLQLNQKGNCDCKRLPPTPLLPITTPLKFHILWSKAFVMSFVACHWQYKYFPKIFNLIRTDSIISVTTYVTGIRREPRAIFAVFPREPEYSKLLPLAAEILTLGTFVHARLGSSFQQMPIVRSNTDLAEPTKFLSQILSSSCKLCT